MTTLHARDYIFQNKTAAKLRFTERSLKIAINIHIRYFTLNIIYLEAQLKKIWC